MTDFIINNYGDIGRWLIFEIVRALIWSVVAVTVWKIFNRKGE